MTVSLLLITHEGIGAQLVAVADAIIKQEMPAVTRISVPADLEPEDLGKYADLIRNTIHQQDHGDGVLVLTDIFGATPDNLARHFSQDHNARVISGINLPMLLRVLNYASQSLEQLSETALKGGVTGIQQGRA